MNRTDMSSFEYSVFVLNEILSVANDPHDHLEIVWNTSLGLAKIRTVIYDQYNFPVLSEIVGSEYIQQDIFNPDSQNSDSFAKVRRSVFGYFYRGSILRHKQLLDRPDLLMLKLLELSKIENTEKIEVPDYTTIFDFQAIDSSLKLPFIVGESIMVKEPICLISKN